MIIEPVRFMNTSGEAFPAPDGRRRKPVVEVRLPHTVTEEAGGFRWAWDGQDRAKRMSWALVDTGADLNYIDEDLADDLSMVIKQKSVTVRGAAGSAQGTLRDAQIILAKSEFLLRTDLATAPLAKQGRKYPLILGMLAISHFRLILDFQRARFELRKL